MKHNDFFEDTQKKVSIVHRNLLYSEDGPEIFEWEEDLEPTLRIGEHQQEIGKKMHEARYGTKEQKQQRWADYQQFIDNWYREHPTHPYSIMKAAAAKYFKCSQKTIQRNTQNPKKS